MKTRPSSPAGLPFLQNGSLPETDQRQYSLPKPSTTRYAKALKKRALRGHSAMGMSKYFSVVDG